MLKRVTVSEAEDQLLETAFELYRIMQRLHHKHEGLKVEYETVRDFYDGAESPAQDGPQSLELEVVKEADVAVENLQNVAEELLKAARLNDAWIRSLWRAKQKERR